MRWLILLPAIGLAAAGEPPVEIRRLSDPGRVEVVARLPEKLLPLVPGGKLTQDQGEAWLRLALVDDDGKDGPAILGAYERRQKELVFRPRYPLLAGHLYRARFEAEKGLPDAAEYRVPPRPKTTPAVVERIEPGADVLPANTLKFYIHFSRPMRGGSEIFDQIRILDADGKAVADPWLRDELWDEKDRRLLLFIHPGRIKWGLLLRQMFGPVLLPGRAYTLVVSRELLDAAGQPLGREFRMKFRTTDENRKRVELAGWKVAAPTAGGREPVKLSFPAPMDHMSLQRFLTVADAAGRPVEGKIAVGAAGRSWSFRPSRPWQAAAYTIAVNGNCEDVAGNTPLRPFDLDLSAPEVAAQRLTLSFRPQRPSTLR